MCVKTKIRLLFVSLLGTELHGRHGFHGKRIKKNLCFPCNPVLGKKQIVGEF